MESLKLNIVKLQELKRLLPYGAIREIAEELDIHRNNVTDVFKGKWENQQVIDLAIEKINSKRIAIQRTEQKIDEVLGNNI